MKNWTNRIFFFNLTMPPLSTNSYHTTFFFFLPVNKKINEPSIKKHFHSNNYQHNNSSHCLSFSAEEELCRTSFWIEHPPSLPYPRRSDTPLRSASKPCGAGDETPDRHCNAPEHLPRSTRTIPATHQGITASSAPPIRDVRIAEKKKHSPPVTFPTFLYLIFLFIWFLICCIWR